MTSDRSHRHSSNFKTFPGLPPNYTEGLPRTP
jgi:hypothetical protein